MKLLQTITVTAVAVATTVSLEAAAPTAQAGPMPIRHVVVLMQENHTFDNELGYWCSANPGRCAGMPATVTLSDGTRVTPGVTPDTVPYEGHSVKSQALAVDGGKMDGWQSVPGCDASTSYSCVSGYLPSAVPDLTALAEPTRSRTTRSPWRTRPPGAGTSTSWPAPRTGSR